MPRGLVGALDLIQLSQRRRPAWSLNVYDIRSTETNATPTRINEVVRANLGLIALPVIVGPRDFTADVAQIQVTEVAGNFARQGIASSTVRAVIVDPADELDPVTNPPDAVDPLADGRWLRQGNVIVLREGDAGVDPADWPITFTGRIQGQPGLSRGRVSQRAELTFTAASREVDYLQRIGTSEDFPQNTAYLTMVQSLAETDMGLDADETNFGAGVGQTGTAFRTTQFVEESPLVSIAKILFVDGAMPRFEGDGRLGVTNGIITKGPVRAYAEPDLIQAIDRPEVLASGINDVIVVGLNPDMTQVVQAEQEIARASISTGFFSKDATIDVRWSEDETQQALGARMIVLSSIGDGPFNFGGESFAPIVAADGGSVRGEIDVDGSIAKGLSLVGLILASLVSSISAFDVAPPLGGPVFPVGRAIGTLLSKTIMAILAQQGRGEYRIVGKPYEFIFEEIVAEVRRAGLRPEEERELKVTNHLINSQTAANTAAERVYRRERASQNRRTITMLHDLMLEPDDIFAVGVGADQRRYMIESLSRVLRRGEVPIATVQGFEVTPGVLP